MINKLLTSEYNYGLYLERPDIIVDASVYRREKDGMEVCSIWNSSHDKPYDIPFRSVNEHLRSLAESDGATKAALCLPNTIWGNICITKPVSIRRGGGNQKAAQTADETDLLKSLGNELGADLIGSESSKMPDDYASYHLIMRRTIFLILIYYPLCPEQIKNFLWNLTLLSLLTT